MFDVGEGHGAGVLNIGSLVVVSVASRVPFLSEMTVSMSKVDMVVSVFMFKLSRSRHLVGVVSSRFGIEVEVMFLVLLVFGLG